MTSHEKTNDTEFSPENTEPEQEQPQPSTTKSSETTKPRTQIRDSTKEKRGWGISIIGGIRAPREDKERQAGSID